MTWRDAEEIALVAMGREKVRDGRHVRSVWRADEDPLAWWCLVELIMERAQPATPAAMTILHFGNTAVPWTVSWSREDSFFVGTCSFTGRPAICQRVAPGVGKPSFGKPHWQRQRQAIAEGRCDLCGKPLKLSTKVSLSHARPVGHGAEGLAILQVEPLLHKACAAESMKFCPSLKRDIEADTLMVRQVNRWRPQFAVLGPQFLPEYVPGHVAKPTDRIIGHAKVELLKWTDRDAEWLGT